MTPEQTVQRAARINAFLNDEVVVAALANMKWKCYDDFVAAQSSEDRVRAWARAKNLEDFANELQTIRDAGEHEVLQAAKDAKAASRKS